MQKVSVTRRVVNKGKWVVYDCRRPTITGYDWFLAYGDRGYARTGSSEFDHLGRMYAPNFSIRMV